MRARVGRERLLALQRVERPKALAHARPEAIENAR